MEASVLKEQLNKAWDTVSTPFKDGIGRLRGDAEAIAALERSVPARASYLLDFF